MRSLFTVKSIVSGCKFAGSIAAETIVAGFFVADYIVPGSIVT